MNVVSLGDFRVYAFESGAVCVSFVIFFVLLRSFFAMDLTLPFAQPPVAFLESFPLPFNGSFRATDFKVMIFVFRIRASLFACHDFTVFD